MDIDRERSAKTETSSGANAHASGFTGEPLSGTPVSKLNKNEFGQPQTYKFEEGELILFPVSVGKLVTLVIFSFGLYTLPWAYRQFNWLKTHGEPGQHPLLYCIFLPISLFGLCKRVSAVSAEAGIAGNLPAGMLACAYFLLNLSSRLPGLLSMISVLDFVPLVVIQQRINNINELKNPKVPIDSRITPWNWFVIAVGAVVWVLALIGWFSPGG